TASAPLMTALAIGRTADPSPGMTCGANAAAPTPTRKPEPHPLNRLSMSAMVHLIPAAPGMLRCLPRSTRRAKSLSHKCAPHDDGRGEVHEGEVVLRLLLPPDEQLATAVEPRGRPFDDPSARLCPVPARAALLAATANMRDVAATAAGVFGIRVVVAFVQAEMLLGVGRGPHDARVQQLADRFLVRPIRRSEGNGDGHPGAVGEMMALGAGLRAIGGIGAGFFPRPAGLCATTRLRTATATAGPRRDHSAGASASRWLRNTPPRPSAGTADGLWSPSRTPAARPSTDSRCAARRAPRRGRAAAAATAVLPSAGILRSATARRSDSTYRPARARRSAHAAASCSAPPPST